MANFGPLTTEIGCVVLTLEFYPFVNLLSDFVITHLVCYYPPFMALSDL